MISSRTPEGESNRCPVCGRLVTIEPSRPLREPATTSPGDAPCPACGHLLWFHEVTAHLGPESTRQVRLAAVRELLTGARERNLPPETLVPDLNLLQTNWGLDSLEIVELVMEVEDGG
jgi:acyl carrier protein